MPYGSPTSNPALAEYSAFLVSTDGVTLKLSIAPSGSSTEQERDDTFQEAIDTLEGLGWTYNGGEKLYGTIQDITVTP